MKGNLVFPQAAATDMKGPYGIPKKTLENDLKSLTASFAFHGPRANKDLKALSAAERQRRQRAVDSVLF